MTQRIPNHGHRHFDDGGVLDQLEQLSGEAVAAGGVGGSGSGTPLVVQEDGVDVVNPATVLNAGHGLDVTDEGGGVAGLAVDETELNGALIPGITTNAELNIEGGQDVIKAHGSMGSTETFDPTDGNVHTGTLDANCTFTLNAPTGSGACTLELQLTQDGTGGWVVTWPGSVTVVGTLVTTAGTTQKVIIETLDGGTTWIAYVVGAGASLTIKDEGTPLATAATSIDFVGAGVTASGSGAAKTVTIPGPSDPTEAQIYGVGGHWELLMDPATSSPPVPLTTPDGSDWVYGWLSDGG